MDTLRGFGREDWLESGYLVEGIDLEEIRLMYQGLPWDQDVAMTFPVLDEHNE